MPDSPTLSERIHGCILGLIVGESMGAPLRHLKPAHIQQLAGKVESFVDPDLIHAERPGRWLPRGMHTAPAQLALLVCEALFSSTTPADALGNLLRRALAAGDGPAGLFREPTQDLTRSSKMVLDETQAPHNALEATAAVALVPLALASQMMNITLEDKIAFASLLAGNGPSASASIVFAEAVAQAMAGDFDRPENFASALDSLHVYAIQVEAAMRQEPGISSLLQMLPGLLVEGREDWARKSIAAEASRIVPEQTIDDPQQPCAVANIVWAIYRCLTDKSFDISIANAVQGGRETNIIAALCGAFAGARLGVQSIPLEWLNSCRGVELARSRADALEQNSPGPLYAFDFFQWESQWTDELAAGREQRLSRMKDLEKKRFEKRESKKKPKSPMALPPTTYARRNPLPPVANPDLDPEEEKKMKLQRSRKRITWKEDRRKGRRREE